VKIIAFDRFKPGVSMETIEPLLARGSASVWRPWKAGVVRENYARADEARRRDRLSRSTASTRLEPTSPTSQ
jgi:hypothetical protein